MLRPLQLWTGQIPPEVIPLLEEFHLALEEQVREIRSLESRTPWKRIISAGTITQSINGVKACISNALFRFATVATTLNLLNTIQSSVDYELGKLPRTEAEYFSVNSKSECLPTTRDKIRSSILDHLKEPKNRFVWLRGSPGTGKTAISISTASALDDKGILAASFFWDKNQKGKGLDSIERFPSTLALQLAAFNIEYKCALIRQLRQPGSLKNIRGSTVERQMKAWVIDPMSGLKDILTSGNDRFVIVLDGLDECGDPEELESLMKLVLLLNELPPTFAILVSCRPESQVVSAWDHAQEQGLLIPCENVDKIAGGETFHTIYCMVEEGFQDCIRKSPWKPSTGDLEVFASACRGLPVIASIRIREVRIQTQSGSSLKLEFDYFRNLREVPSDLNSEYLRILRRAYMSHSPCLRPHVAKNYREVVGALVAVDYSLNVKSMSELLGMTRDDLIATLKPISSVIDLPSNNARTISFYHTTMKEFITGDPIGEESDQVFFIRDVKGYFLGLRFLRLVNDISRQNEFSIPTQLPLGDKRKWEGFRRKRSGGKHVEYAIRYFLDHLDPSLVFSQEPNELQKEFNDLLTQNVLSYITMQSGIASVPRS
ncbi:uncharacterized protein EI90DRAFT_111717 [Cantharellus anzutake]|nr:uncharacterized protein EI90DRAFT_111717 [Cantharellus anzutake]KAF8318286.1 hypothetical protein EI90DRAFT_111717 [Cantharellus anzutake]